MNAEIDKEFAHVIFQTLNQALSSDKTLIDQAQQQLNVLQIRKEYSLVLVSILLDQSCEFSIRQMSGVLFKQFVEVHWSQNSEKFKEPEIDAEIKSKIRKILPLGLKDQTSKIRGSVAYVVATIASWDWPELWPELFDILLRGLNGSFDEANPSQIDMSVVHGSIETLAELVPEVTDLQMPQVAPAILPQIYKIFIDPQNYSIHLRKRAIEIFSSVVEVIADMSEYDPNAGKKYLYRFIPDYVYAMLKVISLNPSESASLIDFSLKKEILKAFTILFKSFSKKLATFINEILAQIWNCLVQSSHLFVQKIVNSNSTDMIDDEEKSSFENLAYQLFEFILILKDKKKYKDTVKKAIDELCYYTILYMQISDEQIENWASNPEQYVQDEDEESYSYSVRISAQELIENISSDFKLDTANAMNKTIERLMEDAQKLRQNNDNNWWKIYESCLLAVSCMKPVFEELIKVNKLEFNLTGFINEFVISCLHESNYPFLVGRALFTASKFPKLLNPQTLETLIKASGSAIQENQNPIIRISAMKAIFCFSSELSSENQQHLLVPHLPQITEGLFNMITHNSSNQIGTLSMETLTSVLAIDEEFLGTIEAKISPLAIALFLKNTSDPLVNSIITDIIKILIKNKYTNQRIEERLMPTLISILNSSLSPKSDDTNFSGLLTSTIDLITMVIRSSTQVPLSNYVMNAFIQIINICVKSEDTAVLQSGGECLRAYVSKSPDQIVNWKDDKGMSGLHFIVMVLNHMLDPKTSENSCSFIGKFITTLIKNTANILGENLDLILKAVLSKMQASDVLLVQQSLVMVFAQLIHSRMDDVLTFLSGLPGPTGKPVLEFFMTEWVSKQNLFVGPYDSKVSILALAKLLEHAITTDDSRFHSIFVRGDRIINPAEGIKTRSKSKTDKELYTQVPLLVKIYKLLINETHGLLEEKKDFNGDYEEEESDDEDEEEDENENKEDIDIDQSEEPAENLYNYLNKYDLFEDAFERDDLEDDPEALEDPLMKIDLLEFLSNFLKTLSQHPCYKLFSEHHNAIERDFLKEIGVTNV
ncbi:importin-9 [Brachionus plicatilis]|uniref:Importin-9 n=1 Tax=Brachionus plicatilis TaxID=10195 RepID=A0A3M7QST6_BRAPC|nr:importin-9 [Brachionus plicatilis]